MKEQEFLNAMKEKRIAELTKELETSEKENDILRGELEFQKHKVSFLIKRLEYYIGKDAMKAESVRMILDDLFALANM